MIQTRNFLKKLEILNNLLLKFNCVVTKLAITFSLFFQLLEFPILHHHGRLPRFHWHPSLSHYQVANLLQACPHLLTPLPAGIPVHTVIKLGGAEAGWETNWPVGRNIFAPCRILFFTSLPEGDFFFRKVPSGLKSLSFCFPAPAPSSNFGIRLVTPNWSALPHSGTWIIPLQFGSKHYHCIFQLPPVSFFNFCNSV